MIARTRPGPYTFADFLELVREDQKADLIDGVIHMASPESIDHNELVLWLGKVLGWFVEERQLGTLTVNKVAYRLSSRNAPEPDVAFVRAERSDIIRSGYVDGPPDLAIEIVSPDSVERDYEDKRRRYEEAGVGEYWIIDPEETRAVFLVRAPVSGRADPGPAEEEWPAVPHTGFIEAELDGHTFHSRIVPGFWLDIRWLWQKPLPPTLPIVQSILASAGPGPAFPSLR